jgi:excisionase family DNA binding protein
MQEDQLLTVKEAAKFLSVHESTVRRLVDSGELAKVMIGKREYRIRRGELIRFVQENESRGEPPQ